MAHLAYITLLIESNNEDDFESKTNDAFEDTRVRCKVVDYWLTERPQNADIKPTCLAEGTQINDNEGLHR